MFESGFLVPAFTENPLGCSVSVSAKATNDRFLGVQDCRTGEYVVANMTRREDVQRLSGPFRIWTGCGATMRNRSPAGQLRSARFIIQYQTNA